MTTKTLSPTDFIVETIVEASGDPAAAKLAKDIVDRLEAEGETEGFTAMTTSRSGFTACKLIVLWMAQNDPTVARAKDYAKFTLAMINEAEDDVIVTTLLEGLNGIGDVYNGRVVRDEEAA